MCARAPPWRPRARPAQTVDPTDPKAAIKKHRTLVERATGLFTGGPCETCEEVGRESAPPTPKLERLQQLDALSPREDESLDALSMV